MGAGAGHAWWDELDTGDGPASLRVRTVGGRVRLVVEVGGDGVDVHLPAATAAELGRALLAAAGVEVAPAGDPTSTGAPSPTATDEAAVPVAAMRSATRPWTVDPPSAEEHREAVAAGLAQLRRLCAVLPETAEIETLGDPSFRVATRMFAVVETVEEVPVVRFKASPEDQAALVEDVRFRADPETGHRGWTALRLDALEGGEELERVVLDSYRLVAPPDVAARLDAALGAGEGSEGNPIEDGRSDGAAPDDGPPEHT